MALHSGAVACDASCSSRMQVEEHGAYGASRMRPPPPLRWVAMNRQFPMGESRCRSWRLRLTRFPSSLNPPRPYLPTPLLIYYSTYFDVSFTSKQGPFFFLVIGHQQGRALCSPSHYKMEVTFVDGRVALSHGIPSHLRSNFLTTKYFLR